MKNKHLTRRELIRRSKQFAMASLYSSICWGQLSRNTFASSELPENDPRFLIVLTATGGASLMDSFLAIRESESSNSKRINCYPDSAISSVEGSSLRAVTWSGDNIGAIPAPFSADQSEFLKKYHEDMMVVTATGDSVNHTVAQHRSVTGNAAWLGRTLQEATAFHYGKSMMLPNVHLLSGTGFTLKGTDSNLPRYALGETVFNPMIWPLALDSSKGVLKAPPASWVRSARRFRNQELDPASSFYHTFDADRRLMEWAELRGVSQEAVEDANLITELMAITDSPNAPLELHGLESSPYAEKILAAFPEYDSDHLDRQAALAFLLLKNRLSATVTLGPGFETSLRKGAALGSGFRENDFLSPPIAFDYSHQAHRAAQAVMWNRVLKLADRLISILKSEEYANGESLWDRTLIYVATDFGRSKTRPEQATEFASAHDLNNGFLLISPLVNGGSVLGGIDSSTGLTYGFDPQTGAPDPGKAMTKRDIYAGVTQALRIDTSGSNLSDIPAMRKQA